MQRNKKAHTNGATLERAGRSKRRVANYLFRNHITAPKRAQELFTVRR